MPMLTISSITYSIGGQPLFQEASTDIPAGHKVGLAGRNGTGKTTLFRLIRGARLRFGINIWRGVTILFVASIILNKQLCLRL